MGARPTSRGLTERDKSLANAAAGAAAKDESAARRRKIVESSLNAPASDTMARKRAVAMAARRAILIRLLSEAPGLRGSHRGCPRARAASALPLEASRVPAQLDQYFFTS